MGVVNKFASGAGTGGPTVVIGPIEVTAETGAVQITDFGGTTRGSAANTTLVLQGSTDNFVGSTVNLDQIEIPTVGTLIKTLDGPILIRPGRWFRVIVSQGTLGAFSATVLGETDSQVNILDLP